MLRGFILLYMINLYSLSALRHGNMALSYLIYSMFTNIAERAVFPLPLMLIYLSLING